MKCGDCTHFKLKCNPETKRALPLLEGRCTYKVQWPALPKAYRVFWRKVAFPIPYPVWANNEESCEFFAKKKQKPAAKQEKLK